MADIQVYENLPYIPTPNQTGIGGVGAQQVGLGILQELEIGAGATAFRIDQSGGWAGANFQKDAPWSFDMFGNMVVNSIVINGLSGATIAASIDANGNFVKQLISNNLNTSTKQILGEFVFYGSGALAIKTDANNGLWISPTGILAKTAGSTTFAIDVNGNATFTGAITASSISGATITGGTITGAVLQTAATGLRTVIDTNNIRFYSGSTLKAFIRPDTGQSVVIGSADDFYLTNINGTPLFKFNSGGDFNMGVAASNITWPSGRKIYDATSSIGFDGDIRPAADHGNDCGTTARRWNNIRGQYIQADNYFVSSDGSHGTSMNAYAFVTMVGNDGSNYYKYRTLTMKDGIFTNVGGESGKQYF